MFIKELQEIGLDKKEAAIYLAGLELGETTVQRIAQKARVNRTTAYRILEILREKGLISSYKKKGGTVIYAENPKKLYEKSKEKLNY